MASTPCFVANIDLTLTEKLKTDLAEQGFTLTQPEHTLFSAQKKGVSCTLYKSGKLTVQGKEKEDFITFYLEPEILKDVTYSYPEVFVDPTPRIGIDESGKGDFFGPLCIAGVQADGNQIQELVKIGVRDSKQLNDKQILILSRKIKEISPHTIVRINPLKYNELYEKFRNLNKLLAWGHATAIAELYEKTGCNRVVIDQFADERVVEGAVKRKNVEIHLTQRHKAESDPVVAAASILARAAFVEGLEKLGREIDFELPKGASQEVIAVGRQVVTKFGKEMLKSIAKQHFKTYDQICSGG